MATVISRNVRINVAPAAGAGVLVQFVPLGDDSPGSRKLRTVTIDLDSNQPVRTARGVLDLVAVITEAAGEDFRALVDRVAGTVSTPAATAGKTPAQNPDQRGE